HGVSRSAGNRERGCQRFAGASGGRADPGPRARGVARRPRAPRALSRGCSAARSGLCGDPGGRAVPRPVPRSRDVLAMKAPIFYYHPGGGPPPQTLALSWFRQHLESISRHGYSTLTVAELLEAGCDLPSRSVALAFDDGLLDNYTQVFPLLLQHGMR